MFAAERSFAGKAWWATQSLKRCVQSCLLDPSDLSELDKQYRPYFVITSCAPMSWAVLHLAL